MDPMSELDDIADQLYALKPDEFSSARDQHIKEARAAGKRDLAKEIGQLRKPTVSAWLINLLWRDQHDVMEQLFELSRELQRAQSEAAGGELRTLTAQRRQLETALLRRAVELGKDAGANVTESTTREAQETLGAALAVPEVADEVRTGRLTKAASYAGFGALPAAGAAPKRPPAEPVDIRDAQRARDEREAAQRRLAEAERAAQSARAALESATRAAEAARQRHDDLRQRLAALREQLQRLEAEEESADADAADADKARDRAEAAHTQAQQELGDAQSSVRP